MDRSGAPEGRSMAKQMIEDLRPGEPVDSVFLVAESSLRTARNGSSYLAVRLQDRSGQIEGRLWDASEAIAGSLQADDFVRVKGVAELYRNELQINIKAITRAEAESLRLRDFLRESERDTGEMLAELKKYLDAVTDPDLRALLDAFFSDEEFVRGFRTAPAATSNHHAWLGGLLEHTLSMTRLALRLVEHYPRLRADLLLVGVFLHDIGKIRELSARRTFQYTVPGQLVGHIVLGALMLEEKARAIEGFPAEKLDVLRHLILSHHGQPEYGAVRPPMLAEAVVLHHLDNIDAKVCGFYDFLEQDAGTDPNFTSRSLMFQTQLYKG